MSLIENLLTQDDSRIDAGLSAFDMADHYGDAELVIGQHHASNTNRQITAFTKWCPAENGIKTFEQAQAAVDLALNRMGQKTIDLMQCQLRPSLSYNGYQRYACHEIC